MNDKRGGNYTLPFIVLLIALALAMTIAARAPFWEVIAAMFRAAGG